MTSRDQEATRGSAPPPEPFEAAARTLSPGKRVGRYVVIGVVGRGGMGVVYAAHDPELDRRVAIKLLLPHAEESEAPEVSQARLQREAQSMASLSHPNVVAVHDVGVFEGRLFIAMELMEGPTLARWLLDRARPWREAVDAFQQAGRGLAAAHAAGLVHRDFKPGNVMFGADGRVRVLDFGLARASGSPPSSPSAAPADAIGAAATRDAARAPLTAPGAWAGTPEYMSPEQLRGQPADAKSDQFSYCASLYEALYGARRFPGETASEVASAIVLGVVREPPPEGNVPAWITAAVLRGLQADPAQRFPSMNALLDALASDPTRARRRRVLGGAAMLLLLSFAASMFLLARRESKPPLVRRQVTHAGNVAGAALSPEGELIAYVVADRLMLLELATGREREALRATGLLPALRWSPDGAWLLFSVQGADGRSASLLPRAGGPAHVVPAVFERATWSPDGGRIASIARAKNQIDVTRRTGGETRELAVGEAGELLDLDWSPSSNRIAFLTRDHQLTRAWSFRSGGGKPILAGGQDMPGDSLRWSPRGDALYWLRGAADAQELIKLPIDPATGRPTAEPAVVLRDLASAAESGGFQISHDAKRLALTEERQQRRDVWVIDNFE